MLDVTRKSTLTGKERTKQLPITQEQMDMYEAGVYIRSAFPDLIEDDIRFIQFGITVAENAAFEKRKESGGGCGAC